MTNATVKLAAPSGASGVFIGGVDYRVDRGTIEVPVEYAEALKAFGYTAFVPEPTKADVRAASKLEASRGRI